MAIKFRELTPAEKELSKKLSEEVEETRLVFMDASMGPHVPGDIGAYIAYLLKDLTAEVRGLKEALGVKTIPLSELVREKTQTEVNDDFRKAGAIPPITKGKEFTKEIMATAFKKPEQPTQEDVSDIKEIANEATDIRSLLSLLFDKPVESKALINKKLKDSSLSDYTVDKLIEMGYIKRVRMFDCSLTEKQ